MYKPTTGKIMTDSVLLESEHIELISQVRYAARRAFEGRKYFPIKKIAPTKSTARWWRGEDMSDADWDFNFGNASKGVTEITYSDVPMPVIHKAFDVNKLNDNPEFIRRNAVNAGLQCKETENKMLVEGLEFSAGSYTIKGLLPSASNSFTTADDFNGAGSVIEAFSGAVAALRADGVMGPFYAALNTTQYGEYEKAITTGGVLVPDVVARLLGGQNRVFLEPDMPAGSGVVWSRNPQYMEYILAEDLTEKSWEAKDKHFYIYMRGRPLIYFGSAICKMNAI